MQYWISITIIVVPRGTTTLLWGVQYCSVHVQVIILAVVIITPSSADNLPASLIVLKCSVCQQGLQLTLSSLPPNSQTIGACLPSSRTLSASQSDAGSLSCLPTCLKNLCCLSAMKSVWLSASLSTVGL